MSSGSAYLVLGIRCKRENFFTYKKSFRECVKGHQAETADPFCPKDGTAFRTVAEEEPTSGFVNLALANDLDANALWESLCEEYGNDLGIHNVSPVASAEDSNKVRAGTTSIALGYRLLSQQGERSGREGMPIDMATLAKRTKELKDHAKGLGLEGEPKLYLTFYW